MLRHTRPLGLVALVAITAVVAAAAAAGADPISDAQAQAQSLQNQISANNVRLDALGQQYDAAQLRDQQAQQTLADTLGRIAAAQLRLAALRAEVHRRAVSDYEGAVSGQSLNALDVGDAQQLLVAQRYAAAQAASNNALIAQVDAAKHALDQQATVQQTDQAAADRDRQAAASARASLEATNAQQQQTLSQVQGQLVVLVAQVQAQQQAADLAAAGGAGDPQAFPNLPGPSAAANQAIAWARTQIGKPYVYAASGPNAYDCSGLVMAAFRTVGVDLPHYSGAMYDLLPHVPLSAAQPGDLLFWGGGGSEHVAFFLGDGRLLEAGGTGNGVHIGPIWGHPIGAARVT